jgi:hypothetical protein
VSRVDASHVWTSAAAGLGILALLGGGFAAARVSRVSPVVVAMALAVAGLTAALLHALASIPFGGG